MKSLQTMNASFDRGNYTVEQYIDECVAANAVPTAQTLFDAVCDTADAKDTQVAYMGACLLLDHQTLRIVALDLAIRYGTSSGEVRAFRTGLRDAGKWIVKKGYQSSLLKGTDATRMTVTFETDGKGGKPKVASIGEARKSTRGARTDKADHKAETKRKLTGPEVVYELVKTYGAAEVEEWLDQAVAKLAEDATTQAAKRAFPGHKPETRTHH